MITGLEDTAGVAPIEVDIVVTPSGARCYRWWRWSIPARVSLPDNDGADRTVKVEHTGSVVGSVTITVWCWSAGLTPAKRTAEFTVLSPDACELPITPDGTSVSGTWTTGCTSSQRGDDNTPHYARRYTFGLKTAARVTASVSSDQATSLYLLSDSHPDEDAPHASGAIEASAPLPAGEYQVEVARIKPRLAGGGFKLTVSVEATACGDGEVLLHGGSCSPAGQRVYEFTKSTVVLTREAAIRELEMNACPSLTVDKLSALMLAIPVRELQVSSPSPMYLGRSDNLAQNKKSEWNYSNVTREHERRAHWACRGGAVAARHLAGSEGVQPR